MTINEPCAPQLRFSEFKDEWSEKKLSAFLKVKSDKNRDDEFDRDEVLSVSGEFGVVNQIEHLGRSYAGSSLKEYKILRTGEIVYTKSPLSTNPYGIIKGNFGSSGIVSTLYAVYETTDEADVAFIDRYFEDDDNMNRYMRPLVNKGAKNDMKIPNERVLIDPVIFPSITEQRKIANFFSKIDEKLSLLEVQLENWREFKRGMMHALFSQQLRFTDDDGQSFKDWEAAEFGQVVERNPRKAPSQVEDSFPCVEMDSLVSNSGIITKLYKLNSQKSNKSYFQSGDVLFGKLRPYLRKFAHPNFDGACSTEIWVLNGKDLLNEFLFQLVQTASFIAASNKTSGSKMPRADWSIMKNFPIKRPTVPEQRKIVQYLSALDGKIISISDRLDATREFKRGLLQKMFV